MKMTDYTSKLGLPTRNSENRRSREAPPSALAVPARQAFEAPLDVDEIPGTALRAKAEFVAWNQRKSVLNRASFGFLCRNVNGILVQVFVKELPDRVRDRPNPVGSEAYAA